VLRTPKIAKFLVLLPAGVRVVVGDNINWASRPPANMIFEEEVIES
jgi:hypothetical protein